MMGLRLSPFRLFFCPLPLAANAAVVATFLAWFMAAFLISAPFIIAKVAAWAASSALVGYSGPLTGVLDCGGILTDSVAGALQVICSACARWRSRCIRCSCKGTELDSQVMLGPAIPIANYQKGRRRSKRCFFAQCGLVVRNRCDSQRIWRGQPTKECGCDGSPGSDRSQQTDTESVKGVEEQQIATFQQEDGEGKVRPKLRSLAD